MKCNSIGEFHDQGDAEWIVIRRQLRDHNDKPSAANPQPALRAELVFSVTIDEQHYLLKVSKLMAFTYTDNLLIRWILGVIRPVGGQPLHRAS